MSPSTRGSATLFASLPINTSWFTRSKNFSRSASTTHRRPSWMYFCASHTASCARQPGGRRKRKGIRHEQGGERTRSGRRGKRGVREKFLHPGNSTFEVQLSGR